MALLLFDDVIRVQQDPTKPAEIWIGRIGRVSGLVCQKDRGAARPVPALWAYRRGIEGEEVLYVGRQGALFEPCLASTTPTKDVPEPSIVFQRIARIVGDEITPDAPQPGQPVTVGQTIDLSQIQEIVFAGPYSGHT